MNKIEHMGHVDMSETFLMHFLISFDARDPFEKNHFFTFFHHFHQGAIFEYNHENHQYFTIFTFIPCLTQVEQMRLDTSNDTFRVPQGHLYTHTTCK